MFFFNILGTVEDYKLLEALNKITITKYTDMKELTENISKGLQDLNEKCKDMVEITLQYIKFRTYS